MIRTIKLAVSAAVLAAITTISAHADLIAVGQVINDPASFSATFHWDLGQGGFPSYSSAPGANWEVTVRVLGGEVGPIIGTSIKHAAAPHGPPEISPNPVGGGFLVAPEAVLDFSDVVSHSGHDDKFHFTFGPLTPTSPIRVITITASHESPAVPDAASTVMLLGMGLTGLGPVRHLLVGN